MPLEMDDGVINETDSVTREELMLSDYVMICCKPIRTQSLILHKMLTLTGALNLIRFREN